MLCAYGFIRGSASAAAYCEIQFGPAAAKHMANHTAPTAAPPATVFHNRPRRRNSGSSKNRWNLMAQSPSNPPAANSRPERSIQYAPITATSTKMTSCPTVIVVASGTDQAHAAAAAHRSPGHIQRNSATRSEEHTSELQSLRHLV